MSGLGTALLVSALTSLGLTTAAGIWELHRARLDWQVSTASGMKPGFLAPANFATAGTASAMLAVTLCMISRILVTGQISLTAPVASCLFLVLGILGAGIYFPVRYHVSAVRLITAIIAIIVLAIASTLPSIVVSTMPMQFLLTLRTTAMAIACGAFTAALGGAVLFLVQAYGSTVWLPPGEVLEEMSGRAAVTGFLATMLAIAFGSLWAGSVMGKYWSSSPLENAGMATCLLYAGYLHARTQPEWRGVKSSAMLIVGFFLALLTFTYQVSM